jgi:hypothetical protein
MTMFEHANGRAHGKTEMPAHLLRPHFERNLEHTEGWGFCAHKGKCTSVLPLGECNFLAE